MDKNVMTFMACDSDYDEAEIVVFGAPFDGTTSFRPGTRFAPPVIRLESFGVETYSPYLNRDLENTAICDIGDLDFPFGNKVRILDMIEETTREILSDDKKPLMIGGEHLVTLGSMRAIVDQYPDIRIIQLDAHADLRNDYMYEELSHATVLKRCWDLVGDDRIYQFGIRSGTKEEFEFAKDHTVMNRFNLNSIEHYIEELKGHPVYLTIDLDVLDPSVFPGTGTPEPGGITFKELVAFLQSLEDLNIVGADVVELSPHYDASGISNAAAVKTVREVLLLMTDI